MFAQLLHTGREGRTAIFREPLVAPSAIPCPANRDMPHELEVEGRDEDLAWVFTMRRCFHCLEPACESACPTTALERQPDGPTTWSRSPGGLVTALEPVLRACNGTWVAAASGDADHETVDANHCLRVPPDDPRYTLHRVWLIACAVHHRLVWATSATQTILVAMTPTRRHSESVR